MSHDIDGQSAVGAVPLDIPDGIVQIHDALRESAHSVPFAVVIGRGGLVTGEIKTPVLFLHGTLDGSAEVNTANMFSAAKMTGTLSYHTLNITGNTGLECKLTKRKEKNK